LLFEEAYVRLLVELGRRQQHTRQLEKLAADFARISAKLAAGKAACGLLPMWRIFAASPWRMIMRPTVQAADDAVAHEGFLARHGQHLPRVLANIARARPPIFRVERTDPDMLPVPELAPATIAGVRMRRDLHARYATRANACIYSPSVHDWLGPRLARSARRISAEIPTAGRRVPGRQCRKRLIVAVQCVTL